MPTNWNQELEEIGALLDDTIAKKASLYERGADISEKPFVNYNEKNNYTSTVDVALYKSYQVYQDIASKYHHTYAVLAGVESEMATYPFGPSFMRFLSDSEEDVTFESIENDIYYFLDADSFVVDEIGYGTDYNFDFVNEIEALKLTVGEGEEQEILECEKIETTGDNDITSAYGFGKNTDGNYRFVLNYCENGTILPVIDQDGNKSELGYEECFVWEINEAIKITAPVQLTYKVKLTNPQTAAGEYGEYDADGSEGYEGLYTNHQAVLFPVATDGTSGYAELFGMPTVSYEVTAAVDPAAPTDPADGNSAQAGNTNASVNDTAAQTGDNSHMAVAMIIMIIAAAGIVVCARRMFINR